MQIVIAHARYHVTCTPMQNLGSYSNFPAPHCLFTMTLLLGSNEDKGVFTRETNVKREIGRSPDQNWANFGCFWGSGGHGFQKVAIFTPKCTSLSEPTSFEPFYVKIGRWYDLQVDSGKNPKPRKSQTPIGKIC